MLHVTVAAGASDYDEGEEGDDYNGDADDNDVML